MLYYPVALDVTIFKMKTKPILLIVFTLIICLTALDYSDQASWGGVCNTGNKQSPIDIDSSSVNVCPTGYDLRIDYDRAKILMNEVKGIDLKVAFENQTRIMLQKSGTIHNFESLQFHWHAPSEHKINGKSFPLELHVVHTNALNNGKLSVLGLLFHDDFYQRQNVFDSINFHSATGNEHPFPFKIQDKFVFHYEGSLTTPPCSEVVDWFVYVSSFPIKRSQIDQMVAQINSGGINNRETQPLNGRRVDLKAGVCKTI